MKTKDQHSSKWRKYYWTQGFLGFLGFLGCFYFKDHDPKYLIYFSFFSQFVYFITGSLAKEIQDERMKENHTKALLLSLIIPLLTLYVIGIYPSFAVLTETIAIIICVAAIVLTFLVYGFSYYYYDRH